MRMGPDAPIREQPVVLVNAAGVIVKSYKSDRQFGRVQHDGVWYTAKRLRSCGLTEIVYFEDIESVLAKEAL